MAPGSGGALARLRRLAGLVVVVLLGGCTAPPAARHASPIDSPRETYVVRGRNAPPSAELAEPQALRVGARVPPEWWRELRSPALDALVEESLRESPTLAAAEARLRAARFLERARAASAAHPQLSAAAGTRREQGSRAQPGGERLFGLLNVGLDVAYDFDISGAQRKAVEALTARTRHEEYRAQGARLTLAASVASTAITEARLAAQLESLERAHAAQQHQLELMRQRFERGSASAEDVVALRLRTERTAAAVAPLREGLARASNQLDVLSGRAPDSGRPAFGLDDFTLPADLPMSVPSELVRNRPDIRAAEALLHAAAAEHGVAVARTYPQLTLSASLGSQALTAASLFGAGSMAWTVAAQVAQPLFKPGLRLEAEAAREAYHEASERYRDTVLQALREVTDALRALESDVQSVGAQRAADVAAQALLGSARRRHAAGVTSYVEVLVAEGEAEQARSELAAAVARRLANTVAFFHAMGVGHADVTP